MYLFIGDLVQVIVVHDNPHRLPKHTKHAPKQHVPHPRTIKSLIYRFCHRNQRRLSQHSKERMKGEVSEGSGDNYLVEGGGESEDKEHGHVATEAHTQARVVCEIDR